jgi:CRISPR-associated protein Cas1
MIKRTLFFANPAYLSTKNEQLVVSFPKEEKETKQIPIEDLGYIILEHPQITVTNGLLQKLVQNKTAVITCDKQYLPCGFLKRECKLNSVRFFRSGGASPSRTKFQI